jgi:hypothetical protein
MNLLMNVQRTGSGPRHRGDPPDDITDLDGEWHVGRYWPGMFPYIEATCDCPKARCGLVIPTSDVQCHEHHGAQMLRQAHRAEDCGRRQRGGWSVRR